MENFNNGLVHTQSWYPLIASSRVGRERCRGIQLFGQRLVVFREKSGRVRVLLARCPHMGADLSDGKVSGGTLEYPFHAWKFDGSGRCTEIPRESDIPRSAHTFSYPVVEKYGFTWIFNGPEPTFDLPDFPRSQLMSLGFVRWSQQCHHHIVVSNAIDLNHWRSVHGFEPREDIAGERLADYGFRAGLRLTSRRRRWLFSALRLTELDATISIFGGNLASIDVHIPWPMHILIAHRPTAGGGSESRLFAFFPRRGKLARWSCAEAATAIGKLGLAGIVLGDDRFVLDKIDFWPRLTRQDRLLASFIQHVNSLPVFQPIVPTSNAVQERLDEPGAHA